MKRYLLAFLLLLVFELEVKATIVKGQILSDGKIYTTTIFLLSYFNIDCIDTVEVGEFGDFKIEVRAPFPSLYAISSNNTSFSFFVNPTEEVIRISLTISVDRIVDGQLEDSKENLAFNALEKLMNQFDNDLIPVLKNQTSDKPLTLWSQNYFNELVSFQKKHPDTYAASVLAQMRMVKVDTSLSSIQNLRAHFFDNVPFTDTSILANPLYGSMIAMYISLLSDTNLIGVSQFMNELMLSSRQNNLVYKRTADILFNNFLQRANELYMVSFIDWFAKAADTTSLPVLQAKLNRLSRAMPGNPLVELNYKNEEGNNESLAATVAKKKLTLMFVWQSTCSHCREALPALKGLYQKYQSKGFEIYAVSLDEEQTAWSKYLKENKLPWKNTIVEDANRFKIEDYYIVSTPTGILFNQQGIIQRRFIEFENLESEIKKYLP